MNLFDNMEAAAFNTVARTMGYDAFWHPGGSPVEEPIAARVLFNKPTTNEEVGNHDYSIGRPSIEYKNGEWPGLKEEADTKTLPLIEVHDTYYYVYKITGQDGKASTSRDGDILVAVLDKANDI